MKIHNKLAVDAVLCISLNEREDRRELVRQEIKKINADAQLEFVLVNKDQEDPQRGCFNSHQQCARIALERQYSRVLVLEDDVLFEGFTDEKIKTINSFLNKKKPEVFYLGAILGKMWLTWVPRIARVRGQGAHAVILSADACKKVNALVYDTRGIDSVYTKIFKIYTVFPMIAYQWPDDVVASDIDEIRGHHGKSSEYWTKVRQKQFGQVVRNLPKTLFFRDL